MPDSFYVALPSAFGAIAIVWRASEGRPQVQRVYLPTVEASAQQLMQTAFAGARPLSHPTIAPLAERMQSFLDGKPVDFDLQWIALERCSEFQRRVLLAEHGIPRGWVSTCGRIARHLELPGTARAVGRALARNPFPIIIPCHRAIKAGGELGGYPGGVEMKRALLDREEVQFSAAGRVVMRKVYY